MEPAVWTEPNDVAMALNRLGVPLEVLREAVQSGYLARISRTTNDAPNAAGFYQWNDTLRSLRENMTTRDWHRNDDGNWPRTVHPDRLHAIAVSSGDENTGRHEVMPSTKTAKGPRTAAAININQLWIPGLEPKDADETAGAEYPTWLLMFYADGKELRSELSLPVAMDTEGHVIAWRERIILPSLPLTPDIDVPEPDFGPDVEIKIAKKG